MADPKEQNIDGVVYTYTTDWIYRLEDEEHWRLYWNQQRLMQRYLELGDTMLEIGPGTGFTTNYLKSKGFKVTTLDIDGDKNPDIEANLVQYDFSEGYDYICAFEVLEHIPFKEVETFLGKISTCCRKGIFLSVPKSEWVLLRADVRLPLIGRKQVELTLPRKKILEPNHFWEAGKTGKTLKQLDETFAGKGFMLKERFKRFSRYFMMYAINH